MAKLHIVVAGNIGVGKSSFCEVAAPLLGATAVYETVEGNPYLADFYADMQRWAFPTQVFFFSQRVKQHREIMATEAAVIQDRSIYEDAEIFARNLAEQGSMLPRDFATYWNLYEAVVGVLTPPDLIVYLRASLPVLKQRIAKRGRSYEMHIPGEYLAKLGRLYDRWAKTYEQSRIISIDTDELDFVGRPEDLRAILACIKYPPHV